MSSIETSLSYNDLDKSILESLRNLKFQMNLIIISEQYPIFGHCRPLDGGSHGWRKVGA